MRNRKFHNDGHANAYLSGSVIRVNDIPVYVTHVEGGRLFYKTLATIKGKGVTADNIPLEHPAIDMNPVPLGFYAIKAEKDMMGAYIKRGPHRQWKIGMTSDNTIAANPFRHAQTAVPSTYHCMFTAAMEDTVLGKYLDPDAAQALAKKKSCAVGFSRNFGVFGDYLLFRDFNEPVGDVVNGKPKLHEDFHYLTQQLKADLNARNHH